MRTSPKHSFAGIPVGISVTFCLMLLSTGSVAHADPSALNAAELVKAAMQASSQQNWAKAVQLYRQALQQEPNNAGLYNNLGVALRRQGDLKGSIAAYRQTLALDPGVNATYVNLAIALLSDQQWSPALQVLQEARTRIPNDPSLLLYQGLAYERLERWTEAVAAYSAYTLNKPDGLGYYRLAIAYWQAGDGSRAVESFRRASRLDPTIGLYSSEAGRALAKVGVTEEAAAFLERLPKDWPDPIDFVVLARLAYKMNRPDVAQTAIQRAIALSQTQNPDGSVNLKQIPASILNDAGVLSADRKDLPGATQLLQAAAANSARGDGSNTTTAIAYSNLADLYLQENQPEQALAAAKEAVLKDPDLPQARNTVAAVLLNRSQVPEAILQLQQAIKLDPNFWQAYRNLAIAYALLGQKEQATQSMQTAIAKAPSLDIVQTLNQELVNLQQVKPLPSPTSSPSSPPTSPAPSPSPRLP